MNKIRVIKSFTLSAIILFSVSCGDNLTPYESTNYAQVSTVKKHGNTEKSAHVTATSAVKDGVHIVKLKEVLPTTKYVYLLVEENNEEFSIRKLFSCIASHIPTPYRSLLPNISTFYIKRKILYSFLATHIFL